jgi:hypothetical protein
MVTMVDFKKHKNAEGKEFAVLILQVSDARLSGVYELKGLSRIHPDRLPRE